MHAYTSIIIIIMCSYFQLVQPIMSNQCTLQFICVPGQYVCFFRFSDEKTVPLPKELFSRLTVHLYYNLNMLCTSLDPWAQWVHVCVFGWGILHVYLSQKNCLTDLLSILLLFTCIECHVIHKWIISLIFQIGPCVCVVKLDISILIIFWLLIGYTFNSCTSIITSMYNIR